MIINHASEKNILLWTQTPKSDYLKGLNCKVKNEDLEMKKSFFSSYLFIFNEISKMKERGFFSFSLKYTPPCYDLIFKEVELNIAWYSSMYESIRTKV